MKNYMFFDTETNGLPKIWSAPVTDVNNWPRIIQLAWIVTDENGLELSREKHLIKPNGWKIPNEKFWIDNGFSQEISEKEGVELIQILSWPFIQDIQICDGLVAHNMNFDKNIVGAEMIRLGLKAKQIEKYCTMNSSTDYCKLPGSRGSYKWPKLIELHQKLFGVGFDGAHDALADVIACKDCFFELVKLGIIKL